jgi:hypothetical protein
VLSARLKNPNGRVRCCLLCQNLCDVLIRTTSFKFTKIATTQVVCSSAFSASPSHQNGSTSEGCFVFCPLLQIQRRERRRIKTICYLPHVESALFSLLYTQKLSSVSCMRWRQISLSLFTVYRTTHNISKGRRFRIMDPKWSNECTIFCLSFALLSIFKNALLTQSCRGFCSLSQILPVETLGASRSALPFMEPTQNSPRSPGYSVWSLPPF